MKLSAISSFALFASLALAAPRNKGSSLAQRLAARAAEPRGTRTFSSSPANILNEGFITKDGNVSHVQYSSNWAGGILTAPPAGETFNSVSGQFTIPTPSVPSGDGDGTYSAAIWVGIDGDTYGTAILQAGVDITITQSGGSDSYSYDSWYEWYPQYAIDFDTSAFSFGAGDTIYVSVQSSDSTDGTVILENLSTGQSVTQAVSAPYSSAALGGQNAEWIVEDFESDGGLVAFADFGTVVFSSAVAGTGSQSVGTSGSTFIEIVDSNGNVITDVSIPDDQSVEVVYS
jgi:hypothetical protein